MDRADEDGFCPNEGPLRAVQKFPCMVISNGDTAPAKGPGMLSKTLLELSRPTVIRWRRRQTRHLQKMEQMVRGSCFAQAQAAGDISAGHKTAQSGAALSQSDGVGVARLLRNVRAWMAAAISRAKSRRTGAALTFGAGCCVFPLPSCPRWDVSFWRAKALADCESGS